MLTARARVQAAVGQLVASRSGERATVALFRSVARGQPTADSDVDLALVLPEEVSTEQRDAVVDELVDHVRSRTGNTAQVLVVDRAGLARMVAAGDPLARSWSSDALTLAGPALKHLLSEPAAGRPRTQPVDEGGRPVGEPVR
ncbi:nucleotidyltransferase domain-containing protein [Quadrisphaera sp. DSM 44207]|uniref:nucleotidyltransferase domain-containing protein n=1 Tax=Quadrisphaera sp. DSM 44207 TaxID=1881057 RepID=UPI00088A5BE0|nr:nucleotidyltransferase domain-containing protein [Quadrisphaera sp. DSM 44207]SDQ85118.1 Nucleotidyltransferase domain-containing protein [Quadrisphaera sp. DSM 44207]